MKKIYYNYKDLEEYNSDMWRTITGEKRSELLNKAIEFTSNTNKYGKYMIKVLDQWPNSSNYNLSDKSINRQAWIGHAACAIALNCPEDIVREAWHYLTDAQRISANIKADIAIKLWEKKYFDKLNKTQMVLF